MEVSNARIFGSVTLSKLIHMVSKVKGKDGKDVEVLILPIEKNRLKKDDNGNVYLNFSGKYSAKMSGATHWMKQSLKKEEYESLTDDQKKDIPFVGSCTIKEDTFADAPNVTDTGLSDDLPAVFGGGSADSPF
jgi:hypothetical protein